MVDILKKMDIISIVLQYERNKNYERMFTRLLLMLKQLQRA